MEHVHVYQGGQAIVGAVAPSGPGRGVGDDTEDDKAPHEKRRSWLKRGNPPGDFSKAPRCGAKTRRGTHCQCLGMPNGSPRATHRRSYAGTWWSLQRRPAPEERQTVLFRTARSGQGRAPFRARRTPEPEHFAHILKESLINPPGRGTLPDGTTFLRAPTIREPNLRIGRWLPRVFGSVSLILEHSAGRRRKSARQAVNARWAKAKARRRGRRKAGEVMDKTSKTILAAIALGLLANALTPLLRPPAARAAEPLQRLEHAVGS